MNSNLKKIRIEKGISQRELSELSQVNFRTIQNYEQGAKDINKAQAGALYRISKALNVTIEDLLEID